MRKDYIQMKIDQKSFHLSMVQIKADNERRKGKLLEVKKLEQEEAKTQSEIEELKEQLEVADNGI